MAKFIAILALLALTAVTSVAAYPQVILNDNPPDSIATSNRVTYTVIAGNTLAGISFNPYTQALDNNAAYANGYHIGYQDGWNDGLQYRAGSCGYYTNCKYDYGYNYPVFNQRYGHYGASYYYSNLHPVQGVIFDKTGKTSSAYPGYWQS